MEPIFYALPDSEGFAERFAQSLDLRMGDLAVRRFPDGESWMRVLSDCQNRDAVVVASLDRPDEKLSQLLFLSETLRDLGARRVGLVAPYLSYMRQDQRFKTGEAVTSRYFSELLSTYFEWLVTLDPHLHRTGSLAELYRIPTYSARSAPFMAHWLEGLDIAPLLVGPDAESEQWVADVAKLADAPYVIFEKTRHGDREVELGEVDLQQYTGRKPVIIDDIISTGTTMAETISRLSTAGLTQPLCVGIHGVFADDAHQRLLTQGAEKVVTCNTIPHSTNAIDVLPAIAEQIAVALQATSADAAE